MVLTVQDEDYYSMSLPLRLSHFIYRIVVVISRFIFSSLYGSRRATVPPIRNPFLAESATSLAEKIRKKELTSEEVVRAYIERIKETHGDLNALIQNRFNEAITEAEAADKLLDEGNISQESLAKERPFHGVPFTTKDCFNITGLGLTAGLTSRKHYVAESDAVVVALLRKAGAIPLGVTNVPEYAMWWESHNYVYGRTNNAYDQTRIPGGSSGGEACLQAIAGSAFGIGSDVGGSIRIPSFVNGTFGHKPTRFSVSNEGHFPLFTTTHVMSFLESGPITRKAVDLKPILQIISGDYAPKLKLDKPVDLKKLKLFYQFDSGQPMSCPVDDEIKDCMIKAVEHLEKKFSVKAKPVKIKKLAKSVMIWYANMQELNTPSLGEAIGDNDKLLNLLIEMLKNIFGYSNNTFIGLFSAIVQKFGVKAGTSEYDYYFNQRQELEEEFKDLLGEDGVFLCPTHPTPALYHNETLIRLGNFGYTAIISTLGLPATNIPMGHSKRERLPIGFQVVSNYDNDRLCLAIAEELDREFNGWIEPALIK